VEQQGEQVLEQEAGVIAQGAEQLVAAGFVANDDGTFSAPGDPLYGDRSYTVDEAFAILADENIVVEDIVEPPIPRAEVEDSRTPIDAEPLPVADVEETLAPAQAYEKAYAAIAGLGIEDRLENGVRSYALTAPTGTMTMDEADAIELARKQGLLTDAEAADATAYAAEYEKANVMAEVGDVSVDQVRQEMQLREEEDLIARNGFYKEPDQDVYWGSIGDRINEGFSKQEVLTDLRYVPAGADLLGDPASTAVSSVAPEPAPLAYERGEYNPNQYVMRGIDPLFEAVDDAQRQAAGVEILRGMATEQPLGITMGPEAEWKTVLSGVVGMKNAQGGDQINYTASMKQSKLLNDFINGAVAEGITPTSPEGFDYIMEQARAAETSDKSAAKVIAALAEVSGAVAPGTAPLPRWRSALARKKIATPGQMKGTAYTKFKGAVAKATITPGSADFDTFMQNFSGSLTDTEAATPFGQKIRNSFPYTPPVVAQAKAAKAKTDQVFGKPKATPKVPPIGAGIAPLVKSPRENAAVNPDPEPITGAAEVTQTKRKNAPKPKTAKQLAAAVAARDKQLATQEEDTQRIGGVVLCAHVGLAKTVYIPRIFGEFSTE
jgi:hypothetical protein